MTSMRTPARAPLGIRDHLLGALLATVYVAVLLATAGDLAMSRDESFYVHAAESYGRWFRLLADDPSAALSREAIDRDWSYNHEHPGLIKSLFALSWLAHERYGLFASDSAAFRFPGMLTAGLLLWLIYIFGARVFDRRAGLFAALAFALLPRPFYHAHLNAFDVPIVLMMTWTVYAYHRSLERRRWAIGTGLAFGLALATKHNSWILPGIFLIHFAWVVWGEKRARRLGSVPRISLVPYWLFGMLVLGPPILVLTWPWLYFDGWSRFLWYARFHLHHEYYNIAYFGTTYFRPPFPISLPFVLTLYTVPLTTIALSCVAFVARARALLPAGLEVRLWPTGTFRADVRCTDVLLVGCLLAPLVLIALPSTPIFGGTKHWFPAYPFLALYAGAGFTIALDGMRRAFDARRTSPSGLMGAFAAAVLLAPSVLETAHSHPFGLSHYGYVAGGVPGAADDGMNRQFWGFTTGSLAPWLRERMPNGGTVWICDTTFWAWQMMQRDGMIPKNIRAVGAMSAADYVIIHHEHHFAEVEYQAWTVFGTATPAHVLTYDGVPIITVYENPRRVRR